MSATILLLAPSDDQAEITRLLREADPAVRIVPIETRTALVSAGEAHPGARLLSVASPMIVPAGVLARLDGPAYNLHPGPPEYPGLFPAVFALYDGAETFGVTLHQMTPDVDAGPIVGANRMPLPAGIDRVALEALSRELSWHLLAGMAAALVDTARPLPPVPEAWRGRARRQADFDALCRLPPDCSEAEFRRRLRAVGEGPNHALRLPAFGRWFRLDPDHPDAPVVKGGRPVTLPGSP